LQQHAIVESSDSSNRIEGNTASYKRIESIVLKNTIPKNRSEQEIAGYRDALALVHESSKDIIITSNNILQFHSYLYRYLPQEGDFYKRSENEIVEKNAKGQITRVRLLENLETILGIKSCCQRGTRTTQLIYFIILSKPCL